MRDDLFGLVEKELNNGVPLQSLKEKLSGQGFLEKDIDEAVNKITRKDSGIENVFAAKEVFDKVGYGFVPTQFINILFYLTGANYLWLGIVNGARTILSIILSSMFQEYSKDRKIGKGVISKAGYLFGFSFLGMAFAALAKSVALFAFFLLLGSIGVVTHGDFYNQLMKRNLKRERIGGLLSGIMSYGVIITGVCMLVSAWILDKFTGGLVTIAGRPYPLHGYLVTFEITAIAFILSGFMLSHVKEKIENVKKKFLKKYFSDMRVYTGTYLRNKHLFLLTFTTIILGFVQVLGNSYYGVYIYKSFENVWLGGYMNVAVIYFIAIIASFLGPAFSKFMNKTTGLAPTLVFGTLLVAMMPLALAYNPNIVAISLANALSVIGAAILGVSQGLLANKLLREDERRVYFSVMSVAAIIPFVIAIPLGAYYAQTVGLIQTFKVLAAILIAIVAPLYIILVLMGSKKKL